MAERPPEFEESAAGAPSTLRLLDDPALDGPANMAREEALLSLVGEHASTPTLRLYQWNQPTISLGYFQSIAEYDALEPPAAGLPVVRRLTGGGAILHDLELTYSLVLPLDHGLLAGGPNALYEKVHDAVVAALGDVGVTSGRCGVSDDSGPARGPFFCFARRHCYDVLVGTDKVAGSAQRRTRHAVLQHGSIVVANRFEQQPTAVLPGEYASRIAAVRTALPIHLARLAGLRFPPGSWTDPELAAAEALIPKYAGPTWTRRA